VEHNLPSAFLIHTLARPGFYVVADYLDVVCILAAEMFEKSSHNGLHSGGEDHDRHVVLNGPRQEVVEVRVELDVVHKILDALVERPGHAVHHALEGVPCDLSSSLGKNI